MAMNKQIEKKIYAELQGDPYVNASDIRVAVRDKGVVTLSGSVPTREDKWAAEEATTRVPGVRVVAEDIEVEFDDASNCDDTILGDSVGKILDSNMWVPKQVIATVERGWVTLRGAVDWDFEKRTAEQAIQDLKGLRGVQNLITLKSRVRSRDVRSKIKTAFDRMVEADTQEISIKTSGGRVTLSGKVHSYNERKEAGSAAWRTPGVVSVRNKLKISSPTSAHH